jgi:hypothetical protein
VHVYDVELINMLERDWRDPENDLEIKKKTEKEK